MVRMTCVCKIDVKSYRVSGFTLRVSGNDSGRKFRVRSMEFQIIFQQSDVYSNFSSEKYFQSNFDKKSSKKVEIFDFCAIFY